MPKKLTNYVRNRRSRWGVKPRLIVLHTTQGHNRPGVGDLISLRNWFDGWRPLSAHYGVDSEGNSIRMVRDEDVAFHCSIHNGWSLGIEQIGFAGVPKTQWIKTYNYGLYRTAAILADWHMKYGIPLRHSRYRGVCQHAAVTGRSGHWDCGDTYPEYYVITWARLIVSRRKNRRIRAKRYEKIIARIQRKYGMRVNTRPW